MQRVCVFTGSSSGRRHEYRDAAADVGRELAARGIALIYGGANVGLMADLADGFLALPGGWGTLDELFEILTWAQLGLHAKPCGVLNAAGYFDPLLAFMDHMIDEGFVKPEYRPVLAVAGSAPDLLDRMAGYRAPAVEQWVERVER